MDNQIALFLGSRSWTADDVLFRCYELNGQFNNILLKKGIECSMVELMDWIGPELPDIHPAWPQSQDFLCHHVVMVGDWTYDFTARQFSPEYPVPQIIHIDKLMELWETVEISSYVVGGVKQDAQNDDFNTFKL